MNVCLLLLLLLLFPVGQDGGGVGVVALAVWLWRTGPPDTDTPFCFVCCVLFLPLCVCGLALLGRMGYMYDSDNTTAYPVGIELTKVNYGRTMLAGIGTSVLHNACMPQTTVYRGF